MKPIFALLALTSTALAGEYAVFASGARLRVDRHETAGANVRLYSNGGTIELPADQVTGFEAEDYVPALPLPGGRGSDGRGSDGRGPEGRGSVAAATPRQLVDAAAKDHGLPPEFVRSVAAAESAFQPQAVSPKGAIGLMQLMPGTARMYGADPTNPEQNAGAGAEYLRDLLLKYDNDTVRALAAYNAGPGAVDKYNGVPPYPETRAFVGRVVRSWRKVNSAEPAKSSPGSN